MKITLCTVRGCRNEGHYCRIHLVQTVKPLPAIKKESDGMKEVMKDYRKEARKFITVNPKCGVKGCSHISEEVHHQGGRIGENLMNKKKWFPVCHDHHRQITDDPTWAEENGYSVSRLQKAKA
jgi:hypothetical protein